MANYGGGNGAVDNDDESLRYENNHNFQIYGHQKFKTGAIRSYGNVIAYATEFGGHWKTPGTIADEPNVMFDNKVLSDAGHFRVAQLFSYHHANAYTKLKETQHAA